MYVPLQSLTVGQVLLGCVSEVRDYELVVSLPHKLVGSVSLAHISRPYTALLSKVRVAKDSFTIVVLRTAMSCVRDSVHIDFYLVSPNYFV